MAATAFLLYNSAKKYIAKGTIVLGTTVLKMKLCTSASNASTFTLSTFASVTSEVAGGGYVANGKALASMIVTAGASAKQEKFGAANIIYSAVGSSIVNIKFAVVGVSGGKALCWSKISTAQFTVTNGNTLTVAFASQGIFTLT